ncbi:MAG: YihY/virulence factor BrkB family protein [Ruminococcus sp.]|nr:YihY/virulence factor BrkB family protein [Ruminococcus sp.]
MKKLVERIKRAYAPVKPFVGEINRHNLFAIAAQSAFFLILSSVPLAMFGVSVLQSMHFPVDTLDRFFSIILNEEASRYMSEFMGNVYENTTGISLVTILVTLWSAAKGIQAITNGLNRIHGTYENRNWLFLRIRSMGYTVVFFAIVLVTMGVVVLGSTLSGLIEDYLEVLPNYIAVIYTFRYLIIFVYLVVLFALIYRNIPNLSREARKENGFLYQLPGAVLCSVSWFVLSLGISIYVDDFNGFSIYGGLTRLAVIMVWLYFCIVCLMLGAELNTFYRIEIHRFYEKLKQRRKRRNEASDS